MHKVTWQGIVVGIFLGILLGPQINKLPGVNKIPSV